MINYEKFRKNSNITKKKFKEYFNELQIEKIKDKMLIEELLESVVHSDSSLDTIKILQNSYNILQVKEKDKLVVDGIMGKKTIDAINGYKNPLELFVWVNMNQFNYFKENNASNNFMKDWINSKVINNVKTYFDEKE